MAESPADRLANRLVAKVVKVVPARLVLSLLRQGRKAAVAISVAVNPVAVNPEAKVVPAATEKKTPLATQRVAIAKANAVIPARCLVALVAWVAKANASAVLLPPAKVILSRQAVAVQVVVKAAAVRAAVGQAAAVRAVAVQAVAVQVVAVKAAAASREPVVPVA